jgi:hypothetical protein
VLLTPGPRHRSAPPFYDDPLEVNMQKVQYGISFFEPGSDKECATFEAETPFQAVSIGDEIIGATWLGSPTQPAGFERRAVARVTRVVRIVTQIDGVIRDGIDVFCEPLADRAVG